MNDWFFIKSFGSKTYRLSIILFLIIAFGLLGLVVVGVSYDTSGGSNLYVYCPDNAVGKCFNPYYMSVGCGSSIDSSSPFCTQEYIGVGESLGVRTPFIVGNIYVLSFGWLILWLLINHLYFNKDFFTKEDWKL
jgi:hypothetical protein